MNIFPNWHILRLLILIIWAVLALVLTTQTDQIPIVRLMSRTIGSTEVGDAMGHAGLFAVLTATAYAAFALRLSRKYALWLAMSLVLCAGTITELSQLFVPGRSSSLSDLLANWLGVFVVGFIAASLTAYPRSNLVKQV